MKVAVASLCSTRDISRNASICTALIRKAAQSSANLVSLPEAADFIARGEEVYDLTHSEENSKFVETLQDSAKENQIWVEAGVHQPCPESKRIFNSHLLINPEGKIVQNYIKTHLFDVDLGSTAMKESDTTIPGKTIGPPVATSIGKVGLLTCYDLRFPEAALSLRHQGAQIITYPSAFNPRTGEAHWDSLLRSRAIETQCYILAASQVGVHFPAQLSSSGHILPARASYGNAMIVNPWGTVVARVANDLEKATSEGELALAECVYAIPVQKSDGIAGLI